MKRITRRGLILGTAGAAIIGRARAQEAWPTRPIQIVMPANAGGATDRMARHLATYLARELGVPCSIVNRPGAASLAGHTYFLAQPDDGQTLLFTPATPYLANNILVQGARFRMEDFAIMNIQEIASSLMVVHKDRPHRTVIDLIADLREPGKLSASVIGGSSEHISLLLMMRELNIPRRNLRLVTYDGGGPMRTAVAGGQVDFAMMPGEGSEVIFEFVRQLATFRDQRDPSLPDAVPINEALRPAGIQLPIIESSSRAMLAHATFRDRQPQRWDRLVTAYRKVLTENREYQESADRGNYGREWRGPEESGRIVARNYELLQRYSPILRDS